jgi:hypothetical protein
MPAPRFFATQASDHLQAQSKNTKETFVAAKTARDGA